MSNARTAIFNRIHHALGRDSLTDHARQTLLDRCTQPLIGIQPKLAHDLVQQFAQQLEKVAGVFAQTDNEEAALAVIQDWLTQKGWGLSAVIDRRLQALPWPTEFSVVARCAEDADQVSISRAFAGIAETGSVVLLSSPDAPTPSNFLPEVHIVLLYHADLLPHIEDVWQKLRTEVGTPPRTVNLITGPSRTADIEQTLQLGAHGPRQLMVVFISESSKW